MIKPDQENTIEVFYRSLFQHSLLGFFITTEDGRFVDCNDALVEMLRCGSRQELLSDTTLRFYFDAADRERYVALLRDRGEVRNQEIRRRRKDGTALWCLENSSWVTNPAGGPAWLQGTLIDITARVEAEELHRKSEERLNLAMQAAKMGAWSWDARTNRSVWDDNAYRLFGMKRGDYEGTLDSLLTLIHPDDREAAASAIRANMESAAPYHAEFRVVRPDGAIRWIVDRGESTFDEAGRIVRAHGVMQDVTDLRELQEQLRRAQRMEAIGQLAGGVAHDFNNLLTVIRGHADLLFDRASADPAVMKDAVAIHRAADRAAAITQQLLAFSRKQVLRPRVFDSRQVVGQMSEMLRRLIGNHIELRTELPVEALWVRADEGQLEQVVLNLGVNARDAMPNGGRLTLKLQSAGPASPEARRHPELPAGDYVHLGVRDTGTGMDAATQMRIFEPFFTTKALGKGTGLGLATVYGVVKQTGGWIFVDSALDRGTSFDVFLPLSAAPTELPRAAAPARIDVGGTETVLIVDDSDEVRQVAASFLRSHGYRVLESADGLAALKLAESHDGAIDALITDVVMPGLGGPALAERLRASRPKLKVIYVSGYGGEPGIIEDAVSRGVPFLQKPFQFSSLARTLRETLG